MTPRKSARGASTSYARQLAFSLIAVLLFFGICEIVARAAWVERTAGQDWWTSHDPRVFRVDPLLGWSLRPNSRVYRNDLGWIETNSLGLRDDEVAAGAHPGEFRAVCLGDSSSFAFCVDGRDKTYIQLAEATLRRRCGSEDVQLINAAVPGYNSYQGLLALEHFLIKLKPDAVTVYLGNNEMYGEFDSPIDVAADSRLLWLKRTALRSYLVAVLRNLLLSSDLIRDSIPRRNDVLSLDAYERNLRSIDALCRANDAELVLFTVPTNPKAEMSGNKSQWRSERAREFYEQAARAQEQGDAERAIALLSESVAEQPRCLQSQTELAALLEARGDCAAALDHYQAAIDSEPYLGRATSRSNALVRELAVALDAPLLDLDALFRARDCAAGQGIVSDALFGDHIHPNEQGHALIAEALCALLAERFAGRLCAPPNRP